MIGIGTTELLILVLTCLCIIVGAAALVGFGGWLVSRRNREFEENLREFESTEGHPESYVEVVPERLEEEAHE